MNHCIELLQRRGFLIDSCNGSFYLSDNSHPDDVGYLNGILYKYDIGSIDAHYRILIEHPENATRLSELFQPVERGTVGVGSNNRTHKWYKIWKRNCADKLPVNWLEANIAMYIKALSACGIYTGGCCDGNHPGYNRLYIEFDGPVYRELHQVLWTQHLNYMFHIRWNSKYDAIFLTDSRQEQYDELFRAGMYLYNNRIVFREARKAAGTWIGNKEVAKDQIEAYKQRLIIEFKKELKHLGAIKP